MTFEAKMRQLLTKNGMSDSQADEVISLAKADIALNDMAERWGDDESCYPDVMANIVWIGVKSVALKWVDKNKPLAWFRPVFV